MCLDPRIPRIPSALTDEHELPSVEAMLAATLALMTGYSQALQAEVHPHQRLLMGAKIGSNLALLADHPDLSDCFHRIALGLRSRWQLMSACTAETDPQAGLESTSPPLSTASVPPCQAPRRLQ